MSSESYSLQFVRPPRHGLGRQAPGVGHGGPGAGRSRGRYLLTHVLPNIAAPLNTDCTLGLGRVIMATAGLSYIGLGAQPPSPEWGAMLSDGREYRRAVCNCGILTLVK